MSPASRRQRSVWGDAWRRLRGDRAAMVGAAIIAAALLVALAAPILAPYEPARQDTTSALRDPFFGAEEHRDVRHPLGTDQLGRDILSRLIWSARVSLLVGLLPVALIFAIGAAVGIVAGYAGGWLDGLLMRVTDVVYAFPDLLFLLIIMATLRNTPAGELFGGLGLIFVGLAIVSWVGMARLFRGQTLALREREFVVAARAVGAGPGRIMVRHLFPNALGPALVAAAFAIPGAMIAEATLSFFGIGVRPPTATWGVMINEGFAVLGATPWPVLLPAACISVVMLAFTFLGDGLRDALDPRTPSR